MSYRNYRIGPELLGVDRCPHCEVAAPLLYAIHETQRPTPRADGGPPSMWAVYACTSCGHLVSARGTPGINAANPYIDKIYPDVWLVDPAIPERAAHYLSQARHTLGQPDASVLMSAASVDAMLRANGLREGSLYHRINKAVEENLIVPSMAEWAHRVRLDANNPRHADEDEPHVTREQAQRAFEFAEALAQFLFVIPSFMPPEQPEEAS